MAYAGVSAPQRAGRGLHEATGTVISRPGPGSDCTSVLACCRGNRRTNHTDSEETLSEFKIMLVAFFPGYLSQILQLVEFNPTKQQQKSEAAEYVCYRAVRGAVSVA